MLPDGSGLDVLRRVRAERLASRVCVISGCGSPTLEAARALKAEHVLIKPIDVKRLIEVLATPAGPAARATPA